MISQQTLLLYPDADQLHVGYLASSWLPKITSWIIGPFTTTVGMKMSTGIYIMSLCAYD